MSYLFYKQAAAVAACLVMTACSNPDIETVQKAASDHDGFTYGQILDHKSNCSSTKWSASKDAHDRAVVTYQCEIAVDAAAGAHLAAPALDTIKMAYEQRANQARTGEGSGVFKSDIETLDRRMAETNALLQPEVIAAMRVARDKDAALQQQVNALYDACTAELQTRRDARLKSVADAYAKIHNLTERFSFTLGEQGIVEKNLELASDGVRIPISNNVAAFLALRMQNPDDRKPETSLLEEILQGQLPLEHDDILYCGHEVEVKALRDQGVQGYKAADEAVMSAKPAASGP